MMKKNKLYTMINETGKHFTAGVPAVYIGPMPEGAHLYKEGERRHRLVYLQGENRKRKNFELSIALVEDNNITQDGSSIRIKDHTQVGYTTGNRPYSGLSVLGHWLLLNRLAFSNRRRGLVA